MTARKIKRTSALKNYNLKVRKLLWKLEAKARISVQNQEMFHEYSTFESEFQPKFLEMGLLLCTKPEWKQNPKNINTIVENMFNMHTYSKGYNLQWIYFKSLLIIEPHVLYAMPNFE